MFSDQPIVAPLLGASAQVSSPAIKHPDAFLISIQKTRRLPRNVSFLSCHKQMVYRLRSLAPTPIHSLNLVTDMTVVFFRELCGSCWKIGEFASRFRIAPRWPGRGSDHRSHMEPSKVP
jgi:hypothetical protein